MKDMVDTQIISRGIIDPLVISAMRSVNRSLFVRESEKKYSFEDTPLPIGFGQTISQPYIVAYMTELLNLNHNHSVLEIGTGSGYQTAILAKIAAEVYSVEAIEELSLRAAQSLKSSGFDNVHLKHGDGYYGWKEKQPYDSIIVTAAAPAVPEPLLKQLKNHGRMIIPVGPEYGTQYLILIEKMGNEILKQKLIPVRFVPFISDQNF